ncbi:type II secretion system F family protein [Pontibacillus marinus]|uniref:Type II secretion protein F n=1 Tax=Pontibacillus marinus BH030004 = DSM 16465 TaxID=1385511 RepID=A0A0A5FU04_9BACI|nr:type II secretion system F family protein [Pontibacillus marinus]KGX83394.1 type II secretion protein F [Pontibacillus marinus BH030004 = DSM 16465]
MFWYITLMVGITTLLFFYGLFHFLFMRNKRLEKRMKRYLEHSDSKKLDKKKLRSLVDIRLAREKLGKKVLSKEKSSKLEALIKKSGLPIKPEEYIFFQIISVFLVGMLLFLISGDLIMLFIGAPIGYFIPLWFIKKKIKDRVKAFNEGLPDMLSTMIGSMRAGFSLPQSLQTVVEEGEAPIKDEIELVLKEMQYGSTLEDSLNGLYERMPSKDLELMVQAIIIQRTVGGNLATVLDKIVNTIRDRTKIQRQITTLTAQGRLSGVVIGLLPVALAFILYLIEPDYIGALISHPIGLIMLVGGAVSGTVGFFMIKKITTIEV